MPRNRASSIDNDYQYFMNLVDQDPMAAGQEFLARLQKGKRTTESLDYIRQLEQILGGEQEAWQSGSGVRDMADAIRFVISNTLMSAGGMGVLRTGRGRNRMEDIVNVVSNMITEDTNFIQLTPVQRRLKMIAESYGYTVYQL